MAKIDFAETWTIPQDTLHVLACEPRSMLDLDLFEFRQSGEMPNEKVGLDGLDIGATLSPGSCEV